MSGRITKWRWIAAGVIAGVLLLAALVGTFFNPGERASGDWSMSVE